jgi:hypothetical protein
MELPDDVISIVREFSRPVTRPDWRNLERCKEQSLLWYIASCYNRKRIPVIERFVTNLNSNHSYHSNHSYLFRAGFIVGLFQN